MLNGLAGNGYPSLPNLAAPVIRTSLSSQLLLGVGLLDEPCRCHEL